MSKIELVNHLHELAMEAAGRAALCDGAAESRLNQVAFRLECEAARMLLSSSDEPTRSVLFRSAASLAIDCEFYAEAQRLIAMGLDGDPPAEVETELRHLSENCRAVERHAQKGGV